jgi:PPOX class probable F420-dependent enzyme
VTATLSDSVRRFLSEPRFAVLATINPDGTPQQTVVWYELRGDRIVLNANAPTQKLRNVRRDPRVSLCVEDGYRFVTISGSVSLIDDRETGLRDILALAHRYDPDPQPGRWDYVHAQHRVSMHLAIEKVVTNGFSD